MAVLLGKHETSQTVAR